jgi:hypothetical protein
VRAFRGCEAKQKTRTRRVFWLSDHRRVSEASLPALPAAEAGIGGLDELEAGVVLVVEDEPAAAVPAVTEVEDEPAAAVPAVTEAGDEPAAGVPVVTEAEDEPAAAELVVPEVEDVSLVERDAFEAGLGGFPAGQVLPLVDRVLLAEPVDGSPVDRVVLAERLVGRVWSGVVQDDSPADLDGCRVGRRSWGAVCPAARRSAEQRPRRRDGPCSD